MHIQDTFCSLKIACILIDGTLEPDFSDTMYSHDSTISFFAYTFFAISSFCVHLFDTFEPPHARGPSLA